MTHNLAKKFDKLVSKLTIKHKETKNHGSDPTDYHFHPVDEEENADHESILQRMKLHLANTNSSKKEHSHLPLHGIPPCDVIINDLKNSPFKGKVTFLFLGTYL